MTIALTYDSALARVQIALSSLTADGTVLVEWSTNELFWQTVRGGEALPVASGAASLDDYEFTDAVPNFYRVRPVNPPAGLLLDGTSGAYASTPDTAVLDITGDIDLRAEATIDNWDSGAAQHFVAKYVTTGNQRSYRLYIAPSGALALTWSPDGSVVLTATSTAQPQPDPVTGRLAVRAVMDVDDGAGNRVVTFSTAPTLEGPWVLLGDPVTTAGTTSIFAGNAALEVGSFQSGTAERAAGVIHAVEVRSGIAGTAVANPDFAAQDNGDTSFTDGAGLTWSVNGTATIIGPVLESDSITPDLGGEVWLKCPRFPFLNRPITVIGVSSIARASRGMAGEVTGRSMPVATVDIRGSRTFTLTLLTDTDESARDMDLILAAGQIMFVQVPSGSTVPGGYVMIGNTGQAPGTDGGGVPEQTFDLPCRVVVPPGADVVGTTMVWGTVFALYGDWQALIASNPSWGDLLATVSSPQDVVVL